MSWDRPFDQAVLLPNGGPARTLRDAANYIRKLPKSEHDGREWRLAIHMLIEAAEDCGTMLFARVGMLRAIEHDAEPRFEPELPQAKDTRRRRRKLSRYR